MRLEAHGVSINFADRNLWSVCFRSSPGAVQYGVNSLESSQPWAGRAMVADAPATCCGASLGNSVVTAVQGGGAIGMICGVSLLFLLEEVLGGIQW